MCGLGTWELLIVLAIVVLLFGATRLPQLGRALGETVRNFKKGSSSPESVGESKKEQELPESKREVLQAHEEAQIVEPEPTESSKEPAGESEEKKPS